MKNYPEKIEPLKEIFNDAQIRDLLKAGLRALPLALSVSEVANHILVNYFAWKKRNIQYSHEEAFQREKELVEMYTKAQADQKRFLAKYYNYYEELQNVIQKYEPLIKNDINTDSPKYSHKGYCFVTFSTVDQAKRFMLTSLAGGIEINNTRLKVILKNDLDHKHFDMEYLVARTKFEVDNLQLNNDAEISKKLIKYYEENLSGEIPGYQNLVRFRHEAERIS